MSTPLDAPLTVIVVPSPERLVTSPKVVTRLAGLFVPNTITLPPNAIFAKLRPFNLKRTLATSPRPTALRLLRSPSITMASGTPRLHFRKLVSLLNYVLPNGLLETRRPITLSRSCRPYRISLKRNDRLKISLVVTPISLVKPSTRLGLFATLIILTTRPRKWTGRPTLGPVFPSLVVSSLLTLISLFPPRISRVLLRIRPTSLPLLELTTIFLLPTIPTPPPRTPTACLITFRVSLQDKKRIPFVVPSSCHH